MNLLLVIDLQNDFINEHSKEAVNDIEKLIASNKYEKVVFTRFVNDKNNPCIEK